MVLGSLFQSMKEGLAKTAAKIGGGLRGLLGRRVDQDFLNRLERCLLEADVGVGVTERLVERVRAAYQNKEADGAVIDLVKSELKAQLADGDNALRLTPGALTVIMVAGVNGSGKTTSIAKLATRLRGEGKKVLLGAGDTFRAAAIEQLDRWARRIGAEIVKGTPGADPSSVAHDACAAAIARGMDVAIIDTAGRLHTQTNLMRELEKIHRVIGKVVPGAPHEVLLVLDATNGQNAIQQAQQFTKSVRCTGLVLAKLDGTAKGGAVMAIREKIGLPVKFVGVGEKPEDLEPFDADAFIEALFADVAA